MTLRERFEKKIMPEPNTGCWLWTAALRNGYGVIGTGNGREIEYAHRLSYEFYKGPVNGMHVRHQCHLPCCVNPDHLLLGTHKQNMEDREQAGRGAVPGLKGSDHAMSKLTEDQALEIFHSKEKGADLARRFNVTPTTVCDIRNGRSWTDATKAENQKVRKKRKG
jgi:hypothetical protein